MCTAPYRAPWQLPHMCSLGNKLHHSRYLLATQIWWVAVHLQAALRCYALAVILVLLAGQKMLQGNQASSLEITPLSGAKCHAQRAAKP